MKRLRPESRFHLLALAAGAPAVTIAVVLVSRSGLPGVVKWALIVLAIGSWLVGTSALCRGVRFRLRTVSNLLAALREGDYSFRVRGGRQNDALGELVLELNLLAETLRRERYGDVESTALLGKVMAEIDVAVLAFDPEGRLCLINRAGARLLGSEEARLVGRSAHELGLSECLDGPSSRTVVLRFAGEGRYELRRGTFRQQGRPHTLLVLSDVSRALRAEEIAAWQRIIRVLGHELNNSLTPIKSIAASIASLVARDPLPAEWREDVQRGIQVIGSRADALNRLMGSYTKLAKLPPPRVTAVKVSPLVGRVAGLETRLVTRVERGEDVEILADGDQIEQVLINLLRNAVDAALQTRGGVTVGWTTRGGFLEVYIDDEGPGLASTDNLFVPFFTTKEGGSGIGLALSRQIVEAHGGTMSLANRRDRCGCRALVYLPLAAT